MFPGYGARKFAVAYRNIPPLANWPGLGIFETSGTVKTKLLRILEETRYLAYHKFPKLGRLQTALAQASWLKARFYGILSHPS